MRCRQAIGITHMQPNVRIYLYPTARITVSKVCTAHLERQSTETARKEARNVGGKTESTIAPSAR